MIVDKNEHEVGLYYVTAMRLLRSKIELSGAEAKELIEPYLVEYGATKVISVYYFVEAMHGYYERLLRIEMSKLLDCQKQIQQLKIRKLLLTHITTQQITIIRM